MIHYSIISPISAAGCGACLEQKDSVYPTCSQALWLQSSEVCLVSIMSRKERAEMIISHKSKCSPMLAPRAEQLLAARRSRMNLCSSKSSNWFTQGKRYDCKALGIFYDPGNGYGCWVHWCSQILFPVIVFSPITSFLLVLYNFPSLENKSHFFEEERN